MVAKPLVARMVRRSHDCPAWRAFGAALGAFSIAVQLVLSAWFIGQAAAAADQADFAVICSHDPAVTGDDTGVPPPPHQHGQCAACGCPQSAKLLAPLPTPPRVEVVYSPSQTLQPDPVVLATQPKSPSPYASRAPPVSA
jgi:hypothetical protein